MEDVLRITGFITFLIKYGSTEYFVLLSILYEYFIVCIRLTLLDNLCISFEAYPVRYIIQIKYILENSTYLYFMIILFFYSLP